LDRAGAVRAAGTDKIRRILGVDPGLSSIGWGLVEIAGNRVRYVAHGCIETRADRPQADRLLSIYTAFRDVLTAWLPVESAMEKLYFARNVSSALPVAEARGVLSMALAEQGLPVWEFTPNAIKKAVTGVVRADKAQVQEMVKFILALDEIPRPDHAADALASAICAAHTVFVE
jgi:crossover junction endodeoxyribonuclease RuvC